MQDASLVEAVERLAREAASWVAKELARTADPSNEATASEPRYQTENDLVYLIQILLSSLATAHTACFTSYLQWLRTTLTSRGTTCDKISQSLVLLLMFFESHLSARQAAKVTPILRAGLMALGSPRDGDATSAAASDDSAWPEASALSRRLIVGDLAGARSVVSDVVEQRRDYLAVSVHLLQPALYIVGEYWQRNQASIAHANMAFEIGRILLSEVLSLLSPRVSENGRSIILAAVESDRHFLGAQIVTTAFDMAGWKATCLNSSFRTSSLIQLIDRHRPDAIGLSVSLLQQLPTLKLTVQRLRAEFGSRCPTIMVGGRPTNEVEDIWRWTGADAWAASAETAVAQLTLPAVRRQRGL
jgi:Predicted cobalamin binding protein